jgi:RNA polymerase sigma-70 factor (ECF subfamily)
MGGARELVSDTDQVFQLLERARDGDTEALEALIGPLRGELLERVRQKMGASLRESLDPDDVVQEVQLRALRSIAKFRWQGEGSLMAWLEGIAANLILQSAKTRSRRKELQVVCDPCAPDLTPSRQARRVERFERLKESVEALPPDYQTAVRLARIEGLKISEIAERMGRSPAAVKNLLFKAMKKLQSSFGDTESMGLPDRRLEGGEGDDGR